MVWIRVPDVFCLIHPIHILVIFTTFIFVLISNTKLISFEICRAYSRYR